MPLEDDYQTEKQLSIRANAMAEGLTEFLKEEGVEDSQGFILFLVDFATGTVQYISDMARESANKAVSEWLKRHIQ